MALHGETMLRTFERCFALTKSMIQSDDQKKLFRKALHFLSVCQVTGDQPSLAQRRKAMLLSAELELFQDAICLSPINKQSKEHNQGIFGKSNWQWTRILTDRNI